MSRGDAEVLFRTVREPAERKRAAKGDAAPTPILPLVGREREIDQLLAAVKQSATGTPAFVFLSGEPGVGKTRLLGETARRCRPLSVRAFVVTAPEQATPYGVFSQLVQDMAKVYFPGQAEPEGTPPSVLGLLRSDASLLTDPGAVNGALRTFLTTISRVTPLMVLLDELARADVESLSALHFLARTLRPGSDFPPRVGFVMAVEPEALSGNETARELLAQVVAQGCGVELAVSRLDGSGVGSLLKAAFPDKDVDDRLLHVISERTQGNPGFALSLLDLLRAEGAVSEDGAFVRLASDALPELPASIVGVVLRRLAALSDKERRLLALASVGEVKLDVEFLTRGLAWGRQDVINTLKALARKGRLLRMNSGAFEFDPAAGRDVIYQELVPEARAAFHGTCARHLEQIHGGSAEHALALARHLDAAGEEPQAALSYLLAGRHYKRRYGWTLTRSCFGRYVEIATAPTADRAEALLGLAEAQLALGQLLEAEAPLAQAADLGKSLALDSVRGHAIMLSARRLFLLGDSRAALVAARLAQEIFEALGDEAALARVVELKGNILHRGGATEEAEIALEAALVLVTKVGDRTGRPSILLTLASMAREGGRHDRALSYIEQALDAAQEIADPVREAEVIHQAGFTRWSRGERAEGQELIRQAIRMAQRHANPRVEASALADLAYALGEEGAMDAAITAATEARDLWRALHERPAEARCHALLASLYARRGPLEEARAYGSAAAMILEEVGDRRTRAWVLAVAARVALATGDAEQAGRLATESLGIAEQIDDHFVSGLALSILGSLLLDAGDAAKGRDLLERSIEDLKAVRALTLLPLARASLGHAFYLAGDTSRGLTLLQEAMTEADQLGSPVARAETTLELGRTLPVGSPQALMVLQGALDVARQAKLHPLVDKLSALLA